MENDSVIMILYEQDKLLKFMLNDLKHHISKTKRMIKIIEEESSNFDEHMVKNDE